MVLLMNIKFNTYSGKYKESEQSFTEIDPRLEIGEEAEYYLNSLGYIIVPASPEEGISSRRVYHKNDFVGDTV